MSTSQLDSPKRHITTVLPTGLSAFADLPLSPPPLTIPGGSVFHLAHAVDNGSSGKPTLSNDLERLQEYTTNAPGIVTPGANLHFIDTAPLSTSPMHRTVSVDYIIVLSGSVTLVLDGGESRVIKSGEVVVQRGTGHLWRNESPTEWVRMLAVVLDIEPVVVGGKELEGYMGKEGEEPTVKLS